MKKESYITKKTGLTEAYLQRLEKLSEQELLAEYSYYAVSVSNAENIQKSALFVGCGVVIAIAINYGIKIIGWGISNNMTRDEINAVIYMTFVLWLVLGVIMIGSLKISFDSITLKRSRYVYLEQYLIKKGLLNR